MRYYIGCKCHLKDTNEKINFIVAVNFKYSRYHYLYKIDNLTEKNNLTPLVIPIYDENSINEVLKEIRETYRKYNYSIENNHFYFFTRKANQKKNITFEFFPIKADSSKQTLFKVGKLADTSKYNKTDYNIKFNIAKLSTCSPGNK